MHMSSYNAGIATTIRRYSYNNAQVELQLCTGLPAKLHRYSYSFAQVNYNCKPAKLNLHAGIATSINRCSCHDAQV